MHAMTRLRQTLGHARSQPASLVRSGRWPLALGTLLLVASTASTVATTNTPPKIISVTTSPEVIEEGQTAVLTVTFSDPDAGDGHTLRVRWRDDYPNGPLEETQIPPGQTSVQVPHTFTRTPTDSTIQVAILDRQTPPGSPRNDNSEGAGKDVVFAPITLKNVAPKFIESSIEVRKQDKRKVTVSGRLIDPGVNDKITVEAAWGDPTDRVPTACSVIDRYFQCEHTYPASWGIPRTYNIGLRALDDDGGMASHQTSVRLP
jgi:hypothetical protein